MSIAPDKIRNLAAAYSLGALDGEEKAIFEKLLRENHPVAVRSYREMAESVWILPYTAKPVSPPEYVKTELFAALDKQLATPLSAREKADSAIDLDTATGKIVAALENKLAWWKKWTFAGALASLLILAASFWYSSQLQEDLNLATFQNGVSTELIELLEKKIEDKATELKRIKNPKAKIYAANPTPDAPANISGRVLFLPDENKATFYGFNLAAETGKDYQLWMIRGSGPVDAGLLTADEEGVYSATVETIPAGELAAFAVSFEPKGGSPNRNANGDPVPSGPVYLVGAITGD